VRRGGAFFAVGFGFGEGLDPRGEVTEGVADEGEGTHGGAFVGGREADEGVDATAAAGVGVGNAEDVGGCVTCLRVTKEDGPARGRWHLGRVCGKGSVVSIPGKG
jgi:hypothetical protein